jgi:antitoxin component YwqK of YwqJK toxin-antitoxin module
MSRKAKKNNPADFGFMKSYISLIVFLLLVIPSTAQFWKKKLNQLDEDGRRTGKWITYWDEEDKIPMSKASFKEGREVGVSKEYHANGNLRLKFRYHGDRIRVKYYSQDRKLEQKGWSVIEYNEKDTHYYWHGKWKFYSPSRKIQRISYYSYGEEIATPVE